MLIVNADDFGMCAPATDAALACHRAGRITSASAMVFMEDSERAAKLALEHGIDVGLHLNFTRPFDGPRAEPLLREHHDRLRCFLCLGRYASVFYNPFLRVSFRYVFQRQHDEFCRLFGRAPERFDGHQHMHLAANVLVDGLLPAGARVRRNFSFEPGERSVLNLAYRRRIDAALARRFRIGDYFFALSDHLAPDRIARMIDLAATATVELMAHPAEASEREALAGEAFAGARVATAREL